MSGSEGALLVEWVCVLTLAGIVRGKGAGEAVMPYTASSFWRATECCSGVVGSKRCTQKSSARWTSSSVRRLPMSALP